MHTTTFAALANMSPHCQNLHPYAAQRMVAVLHILIRKYERLSARLVAARHAQAGVSMEGTTSSGEPVVVSVGPTVAVTPEDTETVMI